MNFVYTTTGTFILLKLLDIYSTWLNFEKYGGGYDTEGNPLMKYLFEQTGWLAPIIVIILTGIAITLASIRYQSAVYYRVTLYSLLVITGLVVISNFMIYLFI